MKCNKCNGPMKQFFIIRLCDGCLADLEKRIQQNKKKNGPDALLNLSDEEAEIMFYPRKEERN